MIRRSLHALIWFACWNASAYAQLQFEFVEAESNVPLVTLSLAELSSDPNDVLSLTFFPEGQERFGFTPVYEGTFDGLVSADDGARFVFDVDDAGRVGLGGHANDLILSTGLFDLNPPDTLLADITSRRFDIDASSIKGPFDRLILEFTNNDGGVGNLHAEGQWLLVPEPNPAVFLIGLAPLLLRLRKYH